MIAAARRYIISQVEGNGMVQESDLLVQEVILAICLMAYYLMDHKYVFKECVKLFNNRSESVNQEVQSRYENKSDDDFPVDMALAETFLAQLKDYVVLAKVESDMLIAAKNLHICYFCGPEEDDEIVSDHED